MRYKIDLILKFFIFSLLFFVLSRAGIYGQVFPFAFAMLFALAWVNQKVWLLLLSYLVGTVANNFSLKGGLILLCTLLMLALPYYLHVLCKKPMRKWELFLYCALSQTAYLVYAILEKQSPVAMVLTFVLGLGFLFSAVNVFEPLFSRGTSYRLTISQLTCGAIVLMALLDGLTYCSIAGFSVVKLCVAFAILLLCHTSSVTTSVVFASIAGLGTMLGSNNPLLVAPFIIWALCSVIFRTKHRIFPAISLILGEILCNYYFVLYYSSSWLILLPTIIGCALFVVIPEKLYDNLKTLFAQKDERMAIKNVVNRNREILHRRLGKLAEVFCEMNYVFKDLIKRQSSEEEVKEMLYDEIKSSVCKGCPEAKHCHRTFCEDTHKIFKELISIAFERGRITLLDMPSYLSSRCGKVNFLISQVNTLTSQYKSYSSLVSNVDTSKLLISDQLSGMSGIMKTLASEVDCEISFDKARESKLIDELSYAGIICTDAVVYEKDARTMLASLVVREEDIEKLKLQQVTSKVCGSKMAIYESFPSPRPGLINVNLKTAPMFDCIFGLASSPKSGNTISGDCHCVERLDGDRFLFAICDGMGNGEKAGQKSERAINLVESFYKAGFENDIILSSVNKLLALEKDDIFSTIDICVIDLKSGIADFVKMGSSSSFLRDENGCRVVESGALPMGILQDVSPLTKKIVLSVKEFVVIASDGVCDTFGSDEDMKDFILTVKSANPQEFADEIIAKALSNNNGYAVDDMTVIVVKIF